MIYCLGERALKKTNTTHQWPNTSTAPVPSVKTTWALLSLSHQNQRMKSRLMPTVLCVASNWTGRSSEARTWYHQGMRKLTLLLLVVSLLSVVPAAFAESPGWRRAKNTADDIIYAGKDRTLYCGCVYTSDSDSDGSG